MRILLVTRDSGEASQGSRENAGGENKARKYLNGQWFFFADTPSRQVHPSTNCSQTIQSVSVMPALTAKPFPMTPDVGTPPLGFPLGQGPLGPVHSLLLMPTTKGSWHFEAEG